MKNLKKTLSLVLVAVMMLGILTIGAGAAFTDQADVDYTEAVDVLSAVGVLAGFEDGSFKPDEILTREQAAKIIAYIMIGKSAADALTTSTAPFTDVPASRWSAGYIAFCVSQGIINGYGDGTFGPADTLTGFQFAKMLLCALGYGKNDEFVGSNWTIEVAKLAIPLEIFSGNVEGASNSPCTREAAALYAFNAMTKCMTVNYSDILGTYYSGTNAFGNPDFDFKYTLANRVHELSREPATVGGRTGYYWLVDKDRITGFYSDDTIIAVKGDGTAIADMLKKSSSNFIAEADANYEVYYNGEPLEHVTVFDNSVYVSKFYWDAVNKVVMEDDGDGKATAEVKNPFTGAHQSGDIPHSGRGIRVELIDSKDQGAKVDVINIIEKTVITVLEDPAEFIGYIKFVCDNSAFNSTSYQAGYQIVGYENLKKGDKALAVIIDGVLQLTKCETITGKLEGEGSFFSVPYYVISGNRYNISQLPGTTVTMNNYETELVYYLDDFGYIVASTVDTSTVKYNYGLVLAAEGGLFNPIQGTGAYAKIQIFNQKGETAIYDIVTSGGRVDVATAQAYSDPDDVGKLVRFRLNSSGKIYSIEEATTTLSGVTYTKGEAKLDSYFVNSSTYFFYYDTTAQTYAVIKGYTNASTLTTATNGAVFTTGFVANAVKLEAAVSGTGEYIYFAGGDYTTGWLADGTVYWQYTVFKDGEQVQMKFATKDAFGGFFGSALPGAYKVEKDPVTELYSWTWLTNENTTPLVYADETYFVGEDTGATYLINSTTKVFLVTDTSLGIVVSVTPTKLVAPTNKMDVVLVAVDAVATTTTDVYAANAVYYKLVPKP